MDTDPASLINIVLNGSSRLLLGKTTDSYRMPGYRAILNNKEISEIITFMRKEWGNNADSVSEKYVENIKKNTYPADDLMHVYKMK